MKTSVKNLILLSFLLSAAFLQGCSEENDGPGDRRAEIFGLSHRVFEYTPAPGQFVNELPKYAEGDTPASMAVKAEAAIAGDKGGLISLGGYGGYVVVGFDHTIENKAGKKDFVVFGNAYNGNSEPGIVLVSVDSNKNGKPDDTWYELAGSEYNNAETIHRYAITYYRPDENKTPVPHGSLTYVTDATYIRWSACEHGEGFIYKLQFHQQSYYPQWINQPELKFMGTKLADNVTVRMRSICSNPMRGDMPTMWPITTPEHSSILTGQ